MNAARSTARTAIVRSARVGRTQCPPRARFQSTSSSSTPKNTASPSSSHIAAGAAGGLAAGLVLYGVYLMTPSGKMQRTINKGVREVNKKFKEASKKLQSETPDVDSAIRYMKDLAYSYVSWIPGGRSYVDTVFKDVETLKEKHRDEVNQIVGDAYNQFRDLSRSGLSLETATRAYNILTDVSKRFAELAGDAFTDILDNHPQIKEKIGGPIDKLKEMGENYGPEAKKQVDETWDEVKKILKGGLTLASVNKIRQLVEEKTEQVKKLGDEVWNKGLEEAKPYLEKNPKVKELIEKNADALKQGNVTELFEQAKKAVESGDLGNLEEYVNKAKSKGEQTAKSLGVDQYFQLIPSGSEILQSVNQLRELAQNHKEEGGKLLKETAEELKELLEKKAQKAKEIAEKAKKDAK